jgi:hypothetical protein
MIFAQVEFLFLLLVGLLTINIGAIVISMPATDASCVASVWLVNAGYTFVLIPLIVKVSAINRLVHAAAGMKRVVLRRESLFGAVFIISGFVAVFLIVWTTLDPPRVQDEYDLTEILSEDGSTIVLTGAYCSSEKDIWTFVAIGWNCIMLLCATVLAVQTRNIQQEFNESQTLAVMIYSHAVFVVLRVVIYTVLSGVVNEIVLASCQSIIFSADTIVTIVIYFVPKLLAPDNPGRKSMFGNFRWMSQSLMERGKTYEIGRAFTPQLARIGQESASEGLNSTPKSPLTTSSACKCSHCGHLLSDDHAGATKMTPPPEMLPFTAKDAVANDVAETKGSFDDDNNRGDQSEEDPLWSSHSCEASAVMEA